MCLGRESYGRTYAVVELSYLQDNIKAVKSHLRKGMQFCAVVKMDAYGHGIVEVARAVEEECSLFGVATIEEGRNHHAHIDIGGGSQGAVQKSLAL